MRRQGPAAILEFPCAHDRRPIALWLPYEKLWPLVEPARDHASNVQVLPDWLRSEEADTRQSPHRKEIRQSHQDHPRTMSHVLL